MPLYDPDTLEPLTGTPSNYTPQPEDDDQKQLDEAVKKADAYTTARRNYLRDKYAWGLSDPLAGKRHVYARDAEAEITDPQERQWLQEEVGKIARMQAAADNEKYNRSGFFGKFAKNLERVGQSFGNAATGQTEAAGKLALMAGGEKVANLFGGSVPPQQDVAFRNALDAAQQGGNPVVPEGAGLALKGAAGMTGMAPDMAAGMATGGPLGIASYWTARLLPERAERYREIGLSPGQAMAAATADAGGQGALEAAIEMDPSGLMKGVSRPVRGAIKRGILAGVEKVAGKTAKSFLKNPMVKRAISEGFETAGRIVGEVGEEVIQGETGGLGEYAAESYVGKPHEKNMGQIAQEALRQGAEAAPGIIGLGGAGGVANTAGTYQRYQRHAEAQHDFATKEEIMKSARLNHTPSVAQWKKWGLPEEDGKNRQARKAAMLVIAGNYSNLEQAQQATSDKAPTDAQWERWGLTDKEGDTADKRVDYLRRKFGVEEQRQAEQAEQPEPVVAEEPDNSSHAAAVNHAGEVRQGKEIPADQWRGVPEGSSIPQGEGIETRTTLDGAFYRQSQEVDEEGKLKYEPEKQAERTVLDTSKVEDTNSDPNFISDESGHIGISLDVVGKVGKKSREYARRFFKSAGAFPNVIFRLDLNRRGDMARARKEVGFAVAEYAKSIKESFGKRNLNKGETELIDDVLRGKVSPSALPKPMQETVGRLRIATDAYSQMLIDLGVVEGEMAVTVAKNMGAYLTRAYRAFTLPTWADEVPQEVNNRALALFRSENPGKSDAELQGMVDAILTKAGRSGSMLGMLHQAYLGDKDLSILKRRKELPVEITELLGEYRDPIINYAMSVTKMADLLANHNFLSEARDAGMGTFFRTAQQGPISEEGRYGKMDIQFEEGPDSKLFPLKGVWTTQEIHDAFKRAVEPNRSPAWLTYYMMANGIVKFGKTAGSWQTLTRNFVSGVGYAIKNGWYHPEGFRNAFQGIVTEIKKSGPEALKGYVLRATELGMWGEGANAGDLHGMMEDSVGGTMEDAVMHMEKRRSNKFKRGLRTAYDTARKIYATPDVFWRLYGWENEKIAMRKYWPDKSEEEIEEASAAIVRDTYQDYEMVPEAVKVIRRFPLVGAFPSFTAEIIRNTYHSCRIAGEELADKDNPERRKHGAMRAASLVTAFTVFPMLSKVSRLLFGITKDEDDRLHSLFPSWQQNSDQFYLGRDPDGNIRHVDLGYSDPHSYAAKIVNSFLRGEDIKNGMWDGLKTAAEPFIEDDILYKAFNEAWSNYDQGGRQIRNPEDTITEQTKATLGHIYPAFEPGTITSGRRILQGIQGTTTTTGQARSTPIEVTAMVLGQRIQKEDIRQSFSYKMGSYKSRVQNATKIFTETIKRKGSVSSGEIIEAYNRASTARRRLFKAMNGLATDVAVLGVPIGDITTIAHDAGFDKEDIGAIYADAPPPLMLTPQMAGAINDANPDEYLDRINAMLQAVDAQ